MKQRYVVKRGPVQPPMSIYGRRAPMQAGDTLESGENPWIRGCLRDGRLVLAEAKKTKSKGGSSD